MSSSDQYARFPRKIRVVKTGGKTQHLISVPRNIALAFQDDVFTCVIEHGRIVFTPIPQESSDAA